ncbi:hypothetical protein RDABS01_036768 [Bienertia sinuspersici]
MLSNVDWVTPPEGVVKVNVDAHIKATGGGGLSVVIRDHAGAVLGAAVRRFEGQWGVKVAEAAAASYGVSLAYRLGFKKVVLESDAASVVNAISRSQIEAAPKFLFFENIANNCGHFDSFNCMHVKRVGNTVAHFMARWNLLNVSEHVFLDNYPKVFIL